MNIEKISTTIDQHAPSRWTLAIVHHLVRGGELWGCKGSKFSSKCSILSWFPFENISGLVIFCLWKLYFSYSLQVVWKQKVVLLVALAAIFHLPIEALSTTILVRQKATMVYHGVILHLTMHQFQSGEIVYLVSFTRIGDQSFKKINS